MKTRTFKGMTENEKILFVIDTLGAKTPETAVTMEEIIAKGIELGATEDYFRENWHGYKEGDHPWWQKVSPMMGVGTREQVEANNEPYLHRKMKKSVKKSGRKTNVMIYWYDPSYEHKLVIREKAKPTPEIKEIRKKFSNDEMEKKMQDNPGKYVVINNKLYLREFVLNHPEKFDAMTLAVANMK